MLVGPAFPNLRRPYETTEHKAQHTTAMPLIAGVLRMEPRQFYVANVLSALAWAPAHVFPGVLLALAVKLTGATGGSL